MEREKVSIQVNRLRSPLVPLALVFCALAVVLGLPGIWMLFDGEYRQLLIADLVAGGVYALSAQQTYLIIQAVLTVLGPLLAATMTVFLAMTLTGKGVEGMGALSTASDCLIKVLNGGGILLICLFAYRFLRYTILCLGVNGGVYNLYAMVISEAVMAVLIGYLFFRLRKFLNCLCDSSASIAYTLATGKLSSRSIPSYTATGFLLLAIACLLFVSDQLFTLTPVYDPFNPHYRLLITEHFAQWAVSASFFCGAVADVLLCIYLKWYKRTCERLLYQDYRKVMGFDKT